MVPELVHERSSYPRTTNHEVIDDRVVLNCLWSDAYAHHGATIRQTCVYRDCRYGSEIAIYGSGATVIVEEAPYEGLSKVRVCLGPDGAGLAVEVQDDHLVVGDKGEEGLDAIVAPEGCTARDVEEGKGMARLSICSHT